MMPMVEIDPKPQGAWHKWMPVDEDAYTYSLRFTDSRGEERIQNWSYTPNWVPAEFTVKSKLVELEKRIIEEGGSFGRAEAA